MNFGKTVSEGDGSVIQGHAMSHTRKTRTADSLSPAAITRPALLHPGCQGTPARRDGTAKHRSTWECRGLNKPQCVWGGGRVFPTSWCRTSQPVPLPQLFLLLLSSPLKATTLCFIDRCLVQRTSGPISLRSLKAQIAACLEHLLALTRHRGQIIPSGKSACQSQ